MESAQIEFNLEPVHIDRDLLPDSVYKTFSDARNYLLAAKKYLQINDAENALLNCKHFLAEIHFARQNGIQIETRQNDSIDKSDDNFRFVALSMLRKQHHFDSLFVLKDMVDNMMDFTDAFFRNIVKKGVNAPKPVISKNEVSFIYSFCIGFFNLVLSGIGEPVAV
jgi:hypothetical protein